MIALAIVLAAVPVPASKADALVAAQQWEELYLAFAAASVKDYAAADRAKLAAGLAKGCLALEASDAVMAYSLGEKAIAFEGTADALICVGRTGQKTEQKSAAEAALKKGADAFPKDARFALELGRLLISENDGAGAVLALEKVPKKSPEAKDAEALLKQARALQAETTSAKGDLSAQQRALEQRQKSGGSAATPDRPPVGAPAGTKVTVKLGGEWTWTQPNVQRVAVADAAIAEVQALGGNQLRALAKARGTTTVLVWLSSGERLEYSVEVQ